MMMDRHSHRGDQYPESHRNWQSATSSWSSDDPHQERNFDLENHRGDFYDNSHHYSHPYNHHNNNFNGDPNNASIGAGDGNTGSAHSISLPVRKRQFSHSGYGPSPDCADGGSFVKLYVGSVARTTTEDEVRSLFGEYGSVVEVILLKDKRTGLQQEFCFVKYAKLEEADRAIGALNNQYTFPGGVVPIKVRYADRERIGSFASQEFKLYIGCLNKQASKSEVEEIFSAYGLVEDIYFVRDQMTENRGWGFVQFSSKDMAVAAINALHGTYFMRGCDQPMIVRFADPKKPRTGDSRCNSRFAPPGCGPRFRQPVARPSPYLGDPIAGDVLHNASDPLSPKIVASCSQVRGGPTAVASGPERAFLGNGVPSSAQQSPQNGSKAPTVSSTSTASDLVVPLTVSSSPAVPISTQMSDPLDCDWSEHTCPDGYKYYYNCTTCESRWEKPMDYTYFEQQLQKLHQQHPSCQQLHSPSNPQVLSTEQVSPGEASDRKKIEQPSFSTMEIDPVHAPASPVIAPTCV